MVNMVGAVKSKHEEKWEHRIEQFKEWMTYNARMPKHTSDDSNEKELANWVHNLISKYRIVKFEDYKYFDIKLNIPFIIKMMDSSVNHNEVYMKFIIQQELCLSDTIKNGWCKTDNQGEAYNFDAYYDNEDTLKLLGLDTIGVSDYADLGKIIKFIYETKHSNNISEKHRDMYNYIVSILFKRNGIFNTNTKTHIETHGLFKSSEVFKQLYHACTDSTLDNIVATFLNIVLYTPVFTGLGSYKSNKLEVYKENLIDTIYKVLFTNDVINHNKINDRVYVCLSTFHAEQIKTFDLLSKNSKFEQLKKIKKDLNRYNTMVRHFYTEIGRKCKAGMLDFLLGYELKVVKHKRTQLEKAEIIFLNLDELDDMCVDKLRLPNRAYNILRRNHIDTVKQLIMLISETEEPGERLKNIRGLGVGIHDQIMSWYNNCVDEQLTLRYEELKSIDDYVVDTEIKTLEISDTDITNAKSYIEGVLAS